MPATETTHYLFEAKPLWSGQIGASGVIDASTDTIPLQASSGLDDGDAYICRLNRVNSNQEKQAYSSTEVFIGKLNGTNLIDCIRGVEGVAQPFNAGTVIEILNTATHWNKMITFLELMGDPNGRIKTQQWYAPDTGTADAYVVTLSPAPTEYTTGMLILVKIDNNNTGACTINVNSLGAKSIKKIDGTDPSADDLVDGSVYLMSYNGTNFQLIGASGGGSGVPVARTTTVTSSATPAINVDDTDIFTITALAVAITSMTTNLTGTPVNGQRLTVRILDNGTARAITWGASFVSRGATLPTSTISSKYLYVVFIYNSTASKWDCMASETEA